MINKNQWMIQEMFTPDCFPILQPSKVGKVGLNFKLTYVGKNCYVMGQMFIVVKDQIWNKLSTLVGIYIAWQR